jgi:Domain of unknown function (DUF4386)
MTMHETKRTAGISGDSDGCERSTMEGAGQLHWSPRFKARMAGASYLLGSLTSVFGQMVVLGMLVVPASTTATAASILSHESLFRPGFVASLMTVPFHLIWAVLFYGLFKPVNRSVSLLAGFVMLLGCAMWAIAVFFSSPLCSSCKARAFDLGGAGATIRRPSLLIRHLLNSLCFQPRPQQTK